MRLQSLKSNLLVAIALFVIFSGLGIALLVTQRYSAALQATIAGQSENLAHAVALEAADRILTGRVGASCGRTQLRTRFDSSAIQGTVSAMSTAETAVWAEK